MKYHDDESWEDLCGHDFVVISYNTPVTLSSEAPLERHQGPWMLLRCRVCQEETVRPYHPGYRVKQEIIPYLLGDATQYTPAERTWIDRFIQANPDLIHAIIQHEAELAEDRHQRHLKRATWNRAYARRLQAWLAK